MTRKPQPQVDDADVDEMVALLTSEQGKATQMTAEERGDLAYDIALGRAKLQGVTSAYAEEFARRVRKRMLWAKPPN